MAHPICHILTLMHPGQVTQWTLSFFTGDGFQNFHTGLSNFSPRNNIKTIMADVKKRLGMDKVAGDFPAGIFSHRGFPRWVLFLPGWEPAGHLAGT